MAHVHEPAYFPPGADGYQVCRCGATRSQWKGRPFGGWHTCSLCVLVPDAPITSET